ncbi:MAG: GspH/FimT family pseudopilin [Methanosarcinaceae archaeon]
MRETILMKKNLGFTLMEVMVTTGIIAIMSAIAVPNYLSWLPKDKMSSAARDIYSAMQYARIRAVKERTMVTINFTTEADSYTVFIDDGRGGGTADNNIADGTETLKTGQMPVGVNMYLASFSGGIPRTQFNARGLPNGVGGSGDVELSSLQNNNLFRQIKLRVSGNPVIRTSADGKNWE